MLQTLRIKNFALIEDQTIAFKKGFNVLVGETGAGKSLVLDALSFVLGSKSNKLNLRKGKDKLFVQAVFDYVSKSVKNVLMDNGIDFDNDELIFSRTMNMDGKTESRINGVIVPVSVVKYISAMIVDTCEQNENVQLLNVKNHLTILDSFSSAEIDKVKTEIENALDEYNNIKSLMNEIGGNSSNRERELELLDYQIKDIENADLKIGEDVLLKEQISKLYNFEKIVDSLKNTNDNLSNVCEKLHNSKNSLNCAVQFDESLFDLSERVSSVEIELQDINESIVQYLNETEFDNNLVNSYENRMETISLLKKKYGSSIEDVLGYLAEIKKKYDNLLFGEKKLEVLEKDCLLLRKKLYNLSLNLSDIRHAVALEIENNVMQELKMLGFKNAVFKVGFSNLPSLEDAVFSKNGLDCVEFLLSANLGQDLKSLSKTISGGEMSRFMLAIKNVFAKCLNATTLVFDEVDTGISGDVGQKVAERLALLSKTHQLICITHLSQVAAMADNYVFVSKNVLNGETYTEISYLLNNDIVKYIASISGAEPTNVALQFASELKLKADNFKNNLL